METLKRPSQGLGEEGENGFYFRGTRAKFRGEQGNIDNIGEHGT